MTYTIDKMGVKPGKHGVTFNWEASPEMPGKPDSVVAVLEEHGPQGTPYEVEVTEGVEDMVIDIE
jgi:hypothetical protein